LVLTSRETSAVDIIFIAIAAILIALSWGLALILGRL
jgi:hypothetical protein